MDDALITLRYSFNLARHGHAIWNQADVSHPSMGYTTVGWMLINAVPAFFTDNKDFLVQFCKLVGLIPLAAIALLLVGQISRMPVPRSFRIAVVLAIFSQVLYGFHLNSGMETLLFSCLILFTVYSYAQANREGTRNEEGGMRNEDGPFPPPFSSLLPRSSLLPYTFGILAFLTRPEGAIVVALLLLWDLRRGRTRQAAAGGICFSIAALSLVLVLHASYGTVLPNAFYVKQGYASVSSLKHTLKFLASIALPFLLLAAYSAYRLKNTASRYCWYAAVVYTVYYLTVSPLMNVFSRYQWPVLVLLTYASLPALRKLGQGKIEQRRLAAGVLLVVALINLRTALVARSLASGAGTAESNLIVLGKAMAKYRDGSKWLAYHDAGAVCYYSDWNSYDTMGLNTRDIAVGSIKPAQVYRYGQTDLIIQNRLVGRHIDTLDESSTAQGCRELGVRLARLGYQYAGSVPILTEGAKRRFEVVLFARNLARAKALILDAQVAPKAPVSPLYRAYAVGGSLLRATKSWAAHVWYDRRERGNA
jgi:arabinofuranosyltransferase